MNITKLALVPLAALALLTMGMSSADAAHPNAKSNAYAKAKKKAERKIAREFRSLDKNHNGTLSKVDFVTYRQSRRARQTRRGYRWASARRAIVSPQYHRIMRIADFNRSGTVTFREYRRAKIAMYIAAFSPKPKPRYQVTRNSVRVRDHRAVAPAPAPRIRVRDHRTRTF